MHAAVALRGLASAEGCRAKLVNFLGANDGENMQTLMWALFDEGQDLRVRGCLYY